MELYFLVAGLFAIGNITLSLYYFIKIRERWRYIKLWYMFANAAILLLLAQFAVGDKPTDTSQFVGLIILLSSQFGGMIVSIAKVRAARDVEKIIIQNLTK